MTFPRYFPFWECRPHRYYEVKKKELTALDVLKIWACVASQPACGCGAAYTCRCAAQMCMAVGRTAANFTASLHRHHRRKRQRLSRQKCHQVVYVSMHCRPGAQRVDRCIDNAGVASWRPVFYSRTVIGDRAPPISDCWMR